MHFMEPNDEKQNDFDSLLRVNVGLIRDLIRSSFGKYRIISEFKTSLLNNKLWNFLVNKRMNS